MSPYGLLQENLNADPWKIFVACIFCNLTSRRTAEPYFWKTLERWPTPEALAFAKFNEMQEYITNLGLAERRFKALTKMSYGYMHLPWKDKPSILYGIGKYGSDAYYLFCTDKWNEVNPTDYALKLYKKWLKNNCTL